MADDLFTAASRMLTEAADDSADEHNEWMQISRQTYLTSTDYYESEMRSKWEHSIALFKSKHPPGSKYYSDAYKHRSKLFRPKPRANVRQHEAACAAAFFSTSDVTSIEAGDDNDESQLATADMLEELLNIRLGDGGIPWFLTLMGAYQNTMVQGAVGSKAYWKYTERPVKDGQDPLTGERFKRWEVLDDKPCLDLIPLENVRFHPDADWRDPANSSPYIIHLIPMFAGDVLAKMKEDDSKTGSVPWFELDLSEVLAHGKLADEDNTTDRARKGNNRSTNDGDVDGTEFSQVWVREYIVRREGQDYVWYTLGSTKMLSEPTEIENVYLHGRPIRIGYSMLEAFNPLPDSLVYTSKDLSAKANDIDNQRNDNIRIILNKRYFIRRLAKIDQKALFRSVPGGSVSMDDPSKDIKWDTTNDVTGSSYAEQDRVNTDFDELTGSFSQGSVSTNRRMNETVGGMEMLNQSSDSITEYQLRIFIETWVEPVLNQIILLEQKYETDDMILAVAAGKADLFQRYGIEEITDHLMENKVTARVNVGMGMTNPVQRVEKFMMGLDSVAKLPGVVQRVDDDEVIKEVFGRLGYKDGQRFFTDKEEVQPQPDPKVQIEQMRLESHQNDIQIESQRFEAELALKERLEMAKLAAQENLTLTQLYEKIGADKEARLEEAKVKLSTTALQEQGRRMVESNRTNEMALKQKMGSGI